jgi:hypothetical protein
MSLNDVKSGDKIVINNGGYCRIAIVERVTPTLIIADGIKYFKKTGNEHGPRSTWASSHISVATEELIAEIEEENRRKMLIATINADCDKQQLRTFSTEKLEKLYDLLKASI